MSKTTKGAKGATEKQTTKTFNEVTINVDGIKQSAELLKAVSHDLRLKIIQFINKKQRVNVNEIYNSLKLEQSITSQSLQYLRNVGAVKTEREGKKIYYSLNEEKFASINQAVELLSK